MSAATELAEALHARRNGSGWAARCVAHDDTHASLSIGEGRDGKPLLKCHAGCSQVAVIDALRERGLWLQPAGGLTVAELAAAKSLSEALLRESGFTDDTVNGRLVVRMDYRDASGNIICTRYRSAADKNGAGPRFWFRRGDKQQLFGLWRLLDQPVILVEGETDAIALWAAGLNALGVPGADAWHDNRFAAALERCPTAYVHVEPDGGGEKFRAAFECSRMRDRVRFFTVAPSAKDPCELRAHDPAAFRAAIEALLAGAEAPGNAPHDSAPTGARAADEPTPLVRPMPPAAPYPIDSLGPVLGPAARAIAEIVQVPAALAGNTILATAALAAQAQANVQTLGGARPLSLYVLTVAGSGDRKTAADDVALAPVRAHMRRATLVHQTTMREYEHTVAAGKLDRQRARKKAKSGDAYAAELREIVVAPPPRKPWLICSAPTAEGLMRSLAEGQYAQGVYTDEGGQLIGGHALSEDSELRTVAMLSRAWQGTTLDRVRATTNEHLVLYGRRLSMHLLAQPAVASRLLGHDLYRSQGFLARWLIAAPESLAGTRQHDRSRPQPADDPRIRRYWHAVGELLERPAVEDHEVGGLDPPCLALSIEARALLIAAYDEIEAAQATTRELEGMRDWASKAAEHACRIAGVLTLAANPAAVEVSVATMGDALALTEHYLGEFARLVGSAGVSEEITRAQTLLDWLRGKSLRSVTPRHVMQYGPNSIRSADLARAALHTLVEHHWAATSDGRTYYIDQAAFHEVTP